MSARYITAILLLAGGWLAILFLAPLYHRISAIYWVVGGLAFVVSVVGGVLYMATDREVSTKPDETSRSSLPTQK